MGFFDSLFGPRLFQSRDRNEVERLVNELVQIGVREDYLSERPGGSFNIQCRNVRSREIGSRLSELGGLNLMNWAYAKVKKKAGKVLASHLEYAWEGVGEWQN